MKLSEILIRNADKYIQIRGDLDVGIDEASGKRKVCAFGLIGWELFPDQMPDILQDTDSEDDMTGIVARKVFELGHITNADISACMGGVSIVHANDSLKLSFRQIGEKLAACGL